MAKRSVLLIALVVVIFSFNSCGDTKTKEELRKEKIEKLLFKSNVNSVNLRVLNRIKKDLKDPNSLKSLGFTYVDKDSIIVVTQKFTAKNGFGGILQNEVILTIDTLGNVIKVNKWFK